MNELVPDLKKSTNINTLKWLISILYNGLVSINIIVTHSKLIFAMSRYDR